MAKRMCIVLVLAIAIIVLFSPAHSQMQTGCTSAMLTSFAPCMTFVTNSTGNGASPPSSACCNSLRSVMSNGTDCFCFMATGSPFRIPINRTMAMSLPRACNMPGVPLQCKATGTPIPAPGPTAFVPSLSPTASTNPSSAAGTPIPAPVPGPTAFVPSLSPTASTNPSSAAAEPSTATSALAPEADSTPLLTPPSSTGTSETPTTDTTGNTGSRPVLNPSAAGISYQFSPSVLFAMLAATILKSYF